MKGYRKLYIKPNQPVELAKRREDREMEKRLHDQEVKMIEAYQAGIKAQSITGPVSSDEPKDATQP